MDKNSRRHLRKVPEKFAFIQIERDEVGRVLNVSEGGLSFSSFGPVPDSGPVFFWFSFDLHNRIEAMGELAWTDLSRKVGGLRFTQLSERGREQIREWLSLFPSREASGVTAGSRIVQEVEPGRLSQGKPDRVANFVAKARSRSPLLSLNIGDEEPLTPIAALKETGSSAQLVPLQRHLSVKKKQLLRGVLLGACISGVVMLAAVKYSGYRHRAEGRAPMQAQQPPAKSDAQILPPATQPSAGPGPVAGDVFNAGKASKAAPPKSTPSKQVAAFYAHAQSQAQSLEPKAPIQPARMPAQLQVSGAASPIKKQMTPEQLWAAVQAGNSRAAVTLAELYIKGEGVPQNCQQARILLLMASEKRNGAAIKRLQELDKDKDTCP